MSNNGQILLPHRVKGKQNMQCYTKSLSQLQQLLLPKLRTANHLTCLLPTLIPVPGIFNSINLTSCVSCEVCAVVQSVDCVLILLSSDIGVGLYTRVDGPVGNGSC